MSNNKILDLYELLPTLYRLRDAEQGYPLRELLEIIAGQADIIKLNIDGLWDDLFIETCDDWVIPYIGDLLGNNPLHEVVKGRRADVAKTIYYRRRKGTLAMLEEVARDVTGWGAHAVEFFELLGWTQNLNHLRYQMAPNPQRRDPNPVDWVGTINLRNLDALDRLDGPFDIISHTVDVRPIGRAEGWHNICKIGFFLWRLGSYPLTGITPRQSNTHPHGYHFSTLGNPAPLFNNPQREADEAGLATEIHVPGPIRPLAFALDLERCRQAFVAASEPKSEYYGELASLSIRKGGEDIPPQSVVCMNLREEWARPPEELIYKDQKKNDVPIPIEVGVDVSSGRLSFAQGKEPVQDEELEVFFHYGFSGNVGGGPYNRQHSLATRPDPLAGDVTWQMGLTQNQKILGEAPDPDQLRETLRDAIQAWNSHVADHPDTFGLITVMDSSTYEEDLTGDHAIDIPLGSKLAVVAADWPVLDVPDSPRQKRRVVGQLVPDGLRPHLRGDLSVRGTTTGDNGDPGELVLDGLLVEGGVTVLVGNLGTLRLNHCTLVPNKGGLKVNSSSVERKERNDRLEVRVQRTICGPITLPATVPELYIMESIVDSDGVDGADAVAIDASGVAVDIQSSTVFGSSSVRSLEASNSIFTGKVEARRRQAGCVRFNYVPEQSQAPRRYRCQPDLALDARAEELELDSLGDRERALVLARVQPAFTSVHYGDPGYCQLSLTCAEEIRTGAEDASEMGAFSHLKQPQREANLRIRLEEYLPFGLEPGLIYVT